MARKAKPGITLHTRQIISSFWFVLRADFMLVLILSVAIFLLTENLVSYINKGGWLSLLLNPIFSNPENDSILVEKFPEALFDFMQWFLYFMILTACITRVTSDTLENCKQPATRSGSIERSLHYLRSIYSAEFIHGLLRCFGIVLIYNTTIMVAIFILSAISILALSLIDSFWTLITLPILGIHATLLVVTRWSMATPATVIEKSSVRKSLASSWRLTGPIWIRLFIMFILIVLPIDIVISLVSTYVIGGTGSAELHSLVITIVRIIQASVFTMLITIQYYFLKKPDG